MPLLAVIAATCFVAALSVRITDPVIPQMARDLGSSPETMALLASAFAIPYALSQPVLGPLGDAIGKARIIKVCLAILFVSLIVSALATSTEMLFAARIVSGVAGGGLIPVSLAVVGDRFDIEHRQVALSRVLAAMLSSTLIGSVASGTIASVTSWRVVLGLAALLTAGALIVAMMNLRPRTDRPRQRFSLAKIVSSYGNVFANPLAKFCFIAVFAEGLMIFGFLPYIAILLEERGAGGIREAGFVLAGMGVGGILYTVLVTQLLRRLRNMFNLIRVGGILASLGFLVVAVAGPWWIEALAFMLIGFGFYAAHNSLQTQATELAPENRGSAVSLHAFSFFLGHAAGPPLYGLAFGLFGVPATMMAVMLSLLVLSFLLASALQTRTPAGARS